MRPLYLVAAVIAPILVYSLAAGQDEREDPALLLALSNSEEVSLSTPTGTLYGTLTMPAGKSVSPVALLIAGSGPTDRDGNSVGLGVGKSDALKLLAAGLADAGIASLRYDKRSVGKSAAARPVINTFDVGVEDAAAWVAWLGKDQRFTGVGIIGHSEGSLVGIMAAQRGGIKALVSLAGGARPFDSVMIDQFDRAAKEGLLPTVAATAMGGALAELRQGRKVTVRPTGIPDDLWTGVFQPRAQDYLISIIPLDPTAEFAKLPARGVKLLVIRGTTDLTGGEGDAERMAGAVGQQPVIIEGMNHEMKVAPLDRAANDKASEDPRRPLAPGLLANIAPFLINALSANHQ